MRDLHDAGPTRQTPRAFIPGDERSDRPARWRDAAEPGSRS